MKLFCPNLVIALLFVASGRCFSQGFLDLNFESANVSGYSPNDNDVPTTSALPGWTASYISSSETNVTSQVWYDGISTGGNIISVIDSNAPGFSPIQGQYSAFLFGGGNGPLYYSTISQTGLVPAGTESILFDGYERFASFVVSLGGQTINMTPLQTFPNYTLYGGNIPSSLAGEVETLSFTQPPASGTQPSLFELDNIQFSTSPVPEPGTLTLCALSGLSVALRSRKKLSA